MSPLVSIVIPTYNRAHLISETLDSIRAQTYSSWECIVVDDGSTDGTDIIVQKYIKLDPRFKYHKRPKNRKKGGNAVRNYGFEISKGEFVSFLDSDDRFYPEKLSIQVKAIENYNTDYHICQCMMYDIDNNKEVGLRAEKVFSENILENYILFKTFWLNGGPLFKKSFLIKEKIKFNENLYQSQDYDFHLKVLRASVNYVYTETPLVKISVHDNNMSTLAPIDVKKIYSNAFVRFEILKYDSENISDNTCSFVYNKILAYFTSVVRLRSIKYYFIFLFLVIKTFKYIDVSFLEKKNTLVKILMSSLYLLTGKGYSLTKIHN